MPNERPDVIKDKNTAKRTCFLFFEFLQPDKKILKSVPRPKTKIRAEMGKNPKGIFLTAKTAKAASIPKTGVMQIIMLFFNG